MAEQMAEETGPPIHFRIGINVGDIIVDLHHIYGDGVSLAAREAHGHCKAIPASDFSNCVQLRRDLFLDHENSF
jgi:class 3 adenylate cyclase